MNRRNGSLATDRAVPRGAMLRRFHPHARTRPGFGRGLLSRHIGHRLNRVLASVLYSAKSTSELRRSLWMSRYDRRRIAARAPPNAILGGARRFRVAVRRAAAMMQTWHNGGHNGDSPRNRALLHRIALPFSRAVARCSRRRAGARPPRHSGGLGTIR